MSAGVRDSQRHIFPRWRSFRATAGLKELALPAIERDVDTSALDESLARGIAEWEGDRSLWRGLDLIGTAVVAGRVEEFSALVAEIRGHPKTPQVAHEALGRLVGPGSGDLWLPDCDELSDLDAPSEIRKSRARLVNAPRDAVEWIELARAFTVAGLSDKARRAISAALQLAPENRFVLRSAARFYLHDGDRERAFGVLATSSVVARDPWVLASQIAVAASLGVSSRMSRRAFAQLEEDIAPADLCELAAALGSMEAESGDHRAARRLLRRALVGANENSIAQIGWLNRTHLGDAVDVSHAKPPLLHEADAWASFYKGKFETAQKQSICWLRDQPFASAPATLASYITADILGDNESGKNIAQLGLRSNPDDPLLLNNYAVCLMELGRLDDADAALARIKKDDDKVKNDPRHAATGGMMAFRRGRSDEGRRLYLEAIEAARLSGDRLTVARATYHLAFEELRAGSPHADGTIQGLKEFEELEDFVERALFLEKVHTLQRELSGREI